MKAPSLLIAAALLGAAVFLLLRGNETVGDEAGRSDAKGNSSRSAAHRSGQVEEEVGERRVRAARRRRVKPAIVTTDSGLQYEVLEKGKGERPGPTSQVTVHYVGTLEDGTVFDSSRERDVALIASLNMVIKGWTEGLQLMRPGAQFRFTIPPELAYGDLGSGKAIPPNATLVFEVELLSVEDD